MSRPLVASKSLNVNPEAQQLHEAGLKAELSGSYPEAHDFFDRAQQILENSPKTLEIVVQSGRIERDDGFTYLRSAIGESNTALLDRSQSIVGRAAENIGWLATNATTGNEENSVSQTARKEVLAEYGATLSLLGRIATVKEVMLGLDNRKESEAATHTRNEGQQAYNLAHNILRTGNNGYYRVSNAMVAARQERLNGRAPKVAMWLGRAVTSIAWTAFQDPSNLKASVMTVGSRIRHLRSYPAAVKSVIEKP